MIRLTARKIVSVNTADEGSGAERVAWNLFKGFERRGLESWLVVGDKRTADPRVLPFHSSPHLDYRPYASPGFQEELRRAKCRDSEQGLEDFHFPFTTHLPTLTGSPPDVLLLHNLHGGYFDLRALASLSRQIPTFLVLHDFWAMTGHCAYPVGCAGWETGCGSCPDLSLPPAISRDASDVNWARKKHVYGGVRLRVATPTRWLRDSVARSILAPAIQDLQVIPCPIDRRTFRPAEREAVRAALGLPQDARILVFGAYRARSNPYKDSATIEAAVRHLAEWLPRQRILFIGLGEAAPEQVVGNTRLRFLPFQPQETLARYLQAADVYVHAARAENAGLIAAEAQACGTPVVATAVGGLGETVAHGERGLLVPAADPEAMAEALRRLLADPPLRHRLGAEAARYAREHWDSARIEKTYLRWFESALSDLPPEPQPARLPDLFTRMARHVTDSYRPSLLRGR